MLSLVNAQSFDIQPYIDLIMGNDLFMIIAVGVLGYLLLVLISIIVGIVKNVKSKKQSKERVLRMRAEKEADELQSDEPVIENEEVEEKQIVVEESEEEEVAEEETYEEEEVEEEAEELVEEETYEEEVAEEEIYAEEEICAEEELATEEEEQEIEPAPDYDDVQLVAEEEETYEEEVAEEEGTYEEEVEDVVEEAEEVAVEEVIEEKPEEVKKEAEDDAFEYVTYEPDEDEAEEEIKAVEVESIVIEDVQPEKVEKKEEVVVEKKKSTKNAPTALSMKLKKAKKINDEEEKVEEEIKTETEEVKEEEKAPQIETESKEEIPVANEEVEEKKNSRYAGKWKIKEIGDGEFSSFLYASNGQLLLTSEIYASADGARSGISTISKNVALEKFEIHSDKNGRYFYKVKSSANRLLCVGETYNTKTACLKSVESVKKFCANAIILDVIEKDITIIKYVPHDEIEVKPGYDGKWKIEGYDDFYMAKLFASNGELLLVGESFKLYESAKANIETIRKNALASNFIIDKDKKGKFYYKLRNAQKSILCVGESYDTQIGAERAIESVKRFAKTAKLVETAPVVEE